VSPSDRPAAPAAVPVAYLAADGLVGPVLEALGDRVVGVQGRLVLAAEPCAEASWWAANTWLAPEWRRIASIGDGARWLRSMQRNWACCTSDWFRRAQLLQEQLPPLRPRPRPFPFELPAAPMGGWTLWEKDLMLASPRCSSPFANGEIEFEDDREGPPSRAFKKLWEALTLLRRRPAPGELCLDLGASPGGWTWALQRLGARVIAVDKAPLAPQIAALDGVEQRLESAFGLDPREVGPVDWLFSDVICYPRRLLELIGRWRDSGAAKRFVCTIKFQGEDEHAVAQEFAALPGARLMHLHHNKHELTFVLCDDAE
jgi:23S rRNA (cytidine2498-2'-O)-methyltransferase